MNKALTFLLACCFIAGNAFSQTPTDSLSRQNQKLIDDLKYRLNTIDQIGKSKTDMESQLLQMQAVIVKQQDSIAKLHELLKNCKVQSSGSDLRSNPEYLKIRKECQCDLFFYKPYQTTLEFDSYQEIDVLIAQLKRENKKIRITGHADKTGDEQQNVVLSKQRALELKNYLKSKAVPDNLIDIEWHGSSVPLTNITEENSFLNRRVEIKLVN